MDNIEEPTLNDEQREELDSMVEEVLNEEENVTIPVNSPTILISEQHSRFSSAVWYQKIQEQSVTLAGLGGIGSYISFLLARIGPKYLFLFDDDIVESANMSGQLYGSHHVRTRKDQASKQVANQFSLYHSIICHGRYTSTSAPSRIMICGFDNMEARRTFYNSWKRFVQGNIEIADKCLYLDGRLNAEEFQIFCIKGNDTYHMDKYEKDWLFSDEEADATVCSYKQTSHCACMIASMMVNLYVNFIANQCDVLVERDLPFFTYYNAETMYMKTES